MKSPKIGIRPGGKYADGSVPLEPTIMGFLKDRAQAVASAVTPTPSAARPIVNAVTQNTGLTGTAVTGMQAQNQANLDALNLASGAVALDGPGTATSDSIPVHLSKGESVLPAATTAALGAGTVKRLIEATNGKSPKIGVRPGGKHADGMVDAETFTPSQWRIARAVYPDTTNPRETIENIRRDDPAKLQQLAGDVGGPPRAPTPTTTTAAIPTATEAPVTTPVAASTPSATPSDTGSVPSGGTVSTVPAGSMGTTDPRLLRQLSEARQAAGARGDWDAVNASYGPGGLKGDGSYGARSPDFSQYPNTIEGVMARKAAIQNFALSQSAANKQAEIGINRQSADTARRLAEIQGVNVGSEMALREAQGQEIQQNVTAKNEIMRLQNKIEDTSLPESVRMAAREDQANLTGRELYKPMATVDAMGNPPQLYNTQTGQLMVPTAVSSATSASAPTQGAIAMLRANPALAGQYDAKYGAGSAKKVLGS